MKIFNNFDTEMKINEYKEAVKKYGEDSVLLVQRYVAFWIIKGLIPLFFVIILNAIALFFIGKIETDILISINLWVVFLLDLTYLYSFIGVLIDYTCDFTLVTPKGIMTYKQKGILNSKLKDLPTSQIRSTQSFRSGLIGNIFSYGIIEIITDGGLGSDNEDGSSQAGKTRLSYVHHPTTIRKKIMSITHIKTQNNEKE